MAGVGGWQILRITPAGKIDRIVEVPVERPSRPWFGGRKLDLLCVTSLGIGLTPGSETRQPWAGFVLAISGLGATGLAQPRFAG
jgi:sugar lactone lactonase YvrE